MILRLGAAAAVILLMPNAAGVLLGSLVALLLPRVIRALPTTRQQRREAERFQRATVLAEVLAAHLVAGVPLLESLESCAVIDDGDLGRATADCARLIRLGSSDPFQPWRRWEYLAPLSRELSRAMVHGGALAASARRAAMRMRDQESRQRRAAVEKVSVRITAPVSLCLLPAFLVLAVVPPAVGLFAKVEISSTSSR